MNKENYEKLPEDKKEILKNTYHSTYNREITPSQFFSFCKETLTEEEYNSVLDENE